MDRRAWMALAAGLLLAAPIAVAEEEPPTSLRLRQAILYQPPWSPTVRILAQDSQSIRLPLEEKWRGNGLTAEFAVEEVPSRWEAPPSSWHLGLPGLAPVNWRARPENAPVWRDQTARMSASIWRPFESRPTRVHLRVGFESVGGIVTEGVLVANREGNEYLVVPRGKRRPWRHPGAVVQLAYLAPDDGADAPWTLEDWQRTLVDYLEVLVRRGDRRSLSGDLEAFNLDHVLPLLVTPDAADVLRRLDPLVASNPEALLAVTQARILAGDETALEGYDDREIRPAWRRDVEARLGRVVDWEFWTRVAVQAPMAALQSEALDRLEEGKGRGIGFLRRAVEDGHVEAPAWLREQSQADADARGHASRMKVLLLTGFGILLFVVLLLLRRRGGGGRRAGTVLVILGLFLAAMQWRYRGIPMRLEWAGYASAAAGAWLLLRGRRDRVGRVALPAFLLAILLGVAFDLAPTAALLLGLSGGLAALGVVALPWAAWSNVAGRDRPTSAMLMAGLGYALPIGGLIVLLLTDLGDALGFDGERGLKSLLWLMALTGLMAILLFLVIRRRRSPRTRQSKVET